jgi:hypothetical protein
MTIPIQRTHDRNIFLFWGLCLGPLTWKAGTCQSFFYWLPKSRNRITIPIQRTHDRNIFLFGSSVSVPSPGWRGPGCNSFSDCPKQEIGLPFLFIGLMIGTSSILVLSLGPFTWMAAWLLLFQWLPKSRNRITIPSQRTHDRNIFLFWCGFRH